MNELDLLYSLYKQSTIRNLNIHNDLPCYLDCENCTCYNICTKLYGNRVPNITDETWNEFLEKYPEVRLILKGNECPK